MVNKIMKVRVKISQVCVHHTFHKSFDLSCLIAGKIDKIFIHPVQLSANEEDTNEYRT